MGASTPDCTLFLSETQLENAVRFNKVEDFFSSWIHESLHARQAYRGSVQEYHKWPGYEEGLVESLTQWILAMGGITNVRLSFPYYASAYDVFSETVGIDVEVLLTALWKHPTGHVRHAFAATINELRSQNGSPALDRLQLAGDVVFRADHDHDQPDHEIITTLIKELLQ